MKTQEKIRNAAEARAKIDQLGDNLKKIKDLQEENALLKGKIETWVEEHGDEMFAQGASVGETERHEYWWDVGAPSLRVQSHRELEDVVELMKGNEVFSEYLLETYDAEAIKDDFGGSKNKRKQVEEVGLYFTTPHPHIKVEGKR